MFRMTWKPGSHARTMMRAIRRNAAIAIGAVALLWGGPAFAQGGGCPSSHALANFQTDPNVGATFTISTSVNSNDTANYTLTSINESPTGGIPGLIEYCVYPSQPPGNPTVLTPLYSDGGGTWNAVFASIQGYFAFKRYDGDPSNIPLDGNLYNVGSATWPLPSSCSPVGYAGCPGAPTTQTILLHVNDPAECSALYGAGSQTCFVFPSLEHGPPNPPPVCDGAPACKDVVVDQAITVDPLTVPGNTRLNLHYTYTIINQPTNTFDMVFYPPTSSTQDVNTGGGKDYFGCEQIPDPSGLPGKFSPPIFANYQGTGFNLNFIQKSGTCNQSYFYLQAPGPNPIVLTPGESITFTIDMITRTNKGGKQEFTSCGLHLLNSGFTVKWFEIPDGGQVPPIKQAGKLFSYSTNIDPIYVNVVGLPGCPLPAS